MAKRSPILGYNHNVLYRGLVFHVQTEDSGLLSPHLFTHLFHGGVILSTRKLVYDAGSAEESIKGLMQSQHKIVLKDLKRGAFDDKIDQYLAGTPGLQPRSTPGGAPPAESQVPAAPAEAAPGVAPEVPVAQSDDPLPTTRTPRMHTEELETLDAIDLVSDRPSEPVITIEHPSGAQPAISRTATPPPIPLRAMTPPAGVTQGRGAVPAQARTTTAERKSAPSAVRSNLPPAPPAADELDPPTDPDVDSGAIHAALVGIGAGPSSTAAVKEPMAQLDSAPEISIKLDLEDDAPEIARTRSKHDTDIAAPTDMMVTDHRSATLSDGVPGAINAAPSGGAVRGGESIPPLPPPPDRKTGDRAPALGAAALPPARPVTRPPSRQAMTPSPVMSRAVDSDKSDSVEIHAPAPASTEPPPGERAERPGQYAQHKRPSSGRVPVDVLKGPPERSGGTAIPSGLGRPLRQSSGMPAIQPPQGGRTQTPSSQPLPVQARTGSPSSQPPAAQPRTSGPTPGTQPRAQAPSQPPTPSRTTTPSRVSPPGGPTARGSNQGSASGGVVMTRPAVIVGAPAKPSQPPRVRKAREDEGRGFGQGLISEKSLDEVILAYLSEDADDK